MGHYRIGLVSTYSAWPDNFRPGQETPLGLVYQGCRRYLVHCRQLYGHIQWQASLGICGAGILQSVLEYQGADSLEETAENT